MARRSRKRTHFKDYEEGLPYAYCRTGWRRLSENWDEVDCSNCLKLKALETPLARGTNNQVKLAKIRKSMPVVYCIESGDYIKIGIAKNAKARLAELQVGNPMPLKLRRTWTVAPGRMPRHTEAEFHRVLKEWRVRGEWFEAAALDYVPTDLLIEDGWII